ncbi:dihydrofolate reductase [Ideonella sp. DXS29W]|uniref:Dihydrofolate reductase n=1 Tax=Ideonella lacteola TaxID=2984193 RepID=A0ABU9BNV3_9BURK
MLLTLIAGVARNGVIGRDNALLWQLPEDMKHFRATTMGAPVIMGRKTWESLPERFRPLPGRHNIVMTRQGGFSAPGATVVTDLDAALAAARGDGASRAFVIGGEQIYREALPLADELMLTEIERDFEGDAHFPDFGRDAFAEVSRERHAAAAPNDFHFAFVTYRRRAPRS